MVKQLVTTVDRTETVPSTDEQDETGNGPCAHIVRTDPGQSAAAAVLEARINGTALTALCGHVFVPQRDPQKLPLCQTCKEIYELMRMANPDLHETPKS